MRINMSYCRFQNTLLALEECADVLADLDDHVDPITTLSESEREAARKLIRLCERLAADYESQEAA